MDKKKEGKHTYECELCSVSHRCVIIKSLVWYLLKKSRTVDKEICSEGKTHSFCSLNFYSQKENQKSSLLERCIFTIKY